jgi:AcrR family transcriptional regulator
MKDLTITSNEIRGADLVPEPKRRGNRTTRVPEILDVAINVFAAAGYVGFTQRRIANEAGIRLNTLQHYFGTREELLRSAIQELARRYIAEYRELARDNARSPDDRLERIVDQVFELLTGPERHAGAFALHCWSLAEHEPFVNELMAGNQSELIDMFSGLIAELNPSLPSGECALRAELIVSHLHGLVVFIRRRGDNETGWDALRVATKAVWKALSRAPQ